MILGWMISLIELAFGNPPIALKLKDILFQDGSWISIRFPLFSKKLFKLLLTNFSPSNFEDRLIWKPGSKCVFSIKSAWTTIRTPFCPIDWAKFVWQPDIPLITSILGGNYLETFFLLMLTSNLRIFS